MVHSGACGSLLQSQPFATFGSSNWAAWQPWLGNGSVLVDVAAPGNGQEHCGVGDSPGIPTSHVASAVHSEPAPTLQKAETLSHLPPSSQHKPVAESQWRTNAEPLAFLQSLSLVQVPVAGPGGRTMVVGELTLAVLQVCADASQVVAPTEKQSLSVKHSTHSGLLPPFQHFGALPGQFAQGSLAPQV